MTIRDIRPPEDVPVLIERLKAPPAAVSSSDAAGGIAHDFNNLLGVITGYSELLRKHLTPQDPGRKRLEQIQKAADRAATLTHQLLAFSRKEVIQPEVLDLNDVVGDIEKMLDRLIGEDVRLVMTLGRDLGCVRADRGQIDQVIMNLAVNARDAMPRCDAAGR